MTTRKRTGFPSLRKCNGRGFVQLNGKRIYLGPWDDPRTREAYERTIAEWLQNGRTLPAEQREITVYEICAAYLDYAKDYYQDADGNRASNMYVVKEALRVVTMLYGSSSAADFGPLAFRTVRDVWLNKELSRTTIKHYTGAVRRIFKWAASHQLIPTVTFQSLMTVDNLRAGRSKARETEPIRPVPVEDVEAIHPFVSRQVWALIQLQLLTGARGGEILPLRAVDINTSGAIWTSTPKKHKTKHHGKTRTIHYGPKAQIILKDFMSENALDSCLFSPQVAEFERYERNRSTCDVERRSRIPKAHSAPASSYSTTSYRRSIVRACKKAGIRSWTPHQLRHTAATRIRAEFGLEATQVILGHSRANVTEIYAETNDELATLVVREIG